MPESLIADASAIVRNVEQFLYYEAMLLDERRLAEWSELFTDDVRYWLPLTEAVQGMRSDIEERGASLLDECKESLAMRVRWLSGRTNVETPPSVTRRLITNVRLADDDLDLSRLRVNSNFLLYQLRKADHESIFIGRRQDTLRSVDGSWKIAERKITLDKPVLDRMISVFF